MSMLRYLKQQIELTTYNDVCIKSSYDQILLSRYLTNTFKNGSLLS